jgi:hypothetical protein
MKYLLLLVVSASLAGCATTAKYEATLNTWVGSSAQALVASWGYPQSQMTAPDGNLAYVYDRQGSIVLPTSTYTNATVSSYGNTAYGNAYSTTYGGGTLRMECQTVFEIGPDQRIVSWHWQGNACKSR